MLSCQSFFSVFLFLFILFLFIPGDDVDSEDEEGAAAAGPVSNILGPDGVVDIEAVKRRLKSTVAVLEDFAARRGQGRSRSDYMDTVRRVTSMTVSCQ